MPLPLRQLWKLSILSQCEFFFYKAVKKVKEKLEKTTLGDITELAALKDQMEAKEEEEKNN